MQYAYVKCHKLKSPMQEKIKGLIDSVVTRVTVKDTSYVPSHNHRRKHSYTAPILKTQQQDTTSSPGSSFYLSLLLTSFLEASHQGPSPAW